MKRLLTLVFYFIPFAVVFYLWVSYPEWVFNKYVFGNIVIGKNFATELGTFGDVYGALNTLFSGLAFSALIISIRLQSRELAETRAELKEQSEQFKKQTEGLHKQTFEATFFQLLNLYKDTINNLRFTQELYHLHHDEYEAVGSDVISILASRMATRANHSIDISDRTFKEYNKFMDSYIKRYGVVFSKATKTIEKILMFVDGANLTKKDKLFYLSLLTAQMTKGEMSFLFYYGIYRKEKYHHLYARTGFLASFDLQGPITLQAFLSYKIRSYGDFSSRYWDAAINELLDNHSGKGIRLHSISSETIPLPDNIDEFKKYVKKNDYVRLIGFIDIVK